MSVDSSPATTGPGEDEPDAAAPDLVGGLVRLPAGAAATWWRSARDGRVLWSHGQLMTLTGMAADDLARLGLDEAEAPTAWLRLVHPEDLPFILRHDEEAADEVMLFRIIRPDGALRWIRSRVLAPEERDGEAGWFGIAEDVTDEQGQVVSDRRAEDLLAVVAARLMEADVDGFDASVDQSLADLGRLVGADRSYVFWIEDDGEHLSNTHEWCTDGVEPMIEHLQHLPAVGFSWFLETVKSSSAAVISVADMPDEEAETRDILEMQGIETLALVPVSHQGEMVGFVGFDSVHDARDWRPAQLGVLRRFAVLLLAAHHRNRLLRELVDARDAAELANESMTRFISRASHELRTPLNAVIGFAQLLDRDISADDREQYLTRLTTAARHLGQITTDLLDVLRADSEHREDAGSHDLHDLLETAAALVEVDARDRDVVVEVAPVSEEAVVQRPDLVRQILGNLVSNAVKYNRPGGRVQVVAECDDGDLVLTVADTGIGIAPELQPRLFAAFDRLGAEATGEPGTGLGLAIAKSAVDTLDGTIVIDSEPEVGTTVTVTIPESSHRTTHPA